MESETLAALQRQVAILQKRLERTEHSQKLIEQAKDHYDLVYRSSISRLAEQKDLLDAQNRELDLIRQELLGKNQELRDARRAADQANEAKSRFLATMSHEIRTPINGILGFLELLELTPLNEEQKWYLHEADSASKVLLFLINDILDFSKIESRQMSLESIPFSLREVIGNAAAIHHPKAIKKGITLNIQLDPELPATLVGDPTRLQQVLNNLLGNGVKFTDRGHVRLKVLASPQPNGQNIVRFEVEDSGIGIEADAMDFLFEPFAQADSSITRKYGGSGLGLVISQELVRLMGGEITVTSEAGVGSTFRFHVPFQTTSAMPEVSAKNRWQLYTAEKCQDLTGFRILLAEDNETNTRLIQLMLKRMGFICDTAADGLQAVKACQQNAYDLILMDCQMPELDGYQASRAIRALHPESDKPIIIAMTANAMLGDREKCVASGMDDYLAKPISGADFYPMIYKYAQICTNTPTKCPDEEAPTESLKTPELLAHDLSKELGVDEEFIQSLLLSLLDSLEPQSLKIAACIDVRDSEAALQLLHALSGVTGNLRLTSVHQLVNRIAEALRNNNWEAAEELSDSLKCLCSHLTEARAVK